MPIQSCPCCSYRLLMHVRHSGVYWFCRHCWQEMPIIGAPDYRPIATIFDSPMRHHAAIQPPPLVNLSSSLEHLEAVR
jgi:hypothetical protein